MPRPRLSIALGVVALLVLAGCFGGGSGQTPTFTRPDRPATPTGVAGTTPTPDGSPWSEGGYLSNVSALIEAHNRTLLDSGFVARGTAGNRTLRYVVAPHRQRFRVDPIPDGSNPAVWANETLVLARQPTGNGTTYHRPSRDWVATGTMTGTARMEALLSLATYARSGTTACGDGECVVFRANESSADGYANFTAVVHVSSSGVVRAFHAEYDRTLSGSTTHLEYRFEVRQVGEVSVDRPGWVSAAIAATR